MGGYSITVSFLDVFVVRVVVIIVSRVIISGINLLQVASLVDQPDNNATKGDQSEELSLDGQLSEARGTVSHSDSDNGIHLDLLLLDLITLLPGLLILSLLTLKGKETIDLTEEFETIVAGFGITMGGSERDGVATIEGGDWEGGEGSGAVLEEDACLELGILFIIISTRY